MNRNLLPKSVRYYLEDEVLPNEGKYNVQSSNEGDDPGSFVLEGECHAEL